MQVVKELIHYRRTSMSNFELSEVAMLSYCTNFGNKKDKRRYMQNTNGNAVFCPTLKTAGQIRIKSNKFKRKEKKRN